MYTVRVARPLVTSFTSSYSSGQRRHLFSQAETMVTERRGQDLPGIRFWHESAGRYCKSAVIHSKISSSILFSATCSWNSQQLELLLIYSLGLEAGDGFCGLTRDDVRLDKNNGRSCKEKTNPRALLYIYDGINVFKHVEVNMWKL